MQHELLASLHQHLVKLFHVQLGAECDCRKGLGLPAGEDCGPVRTWQVSGLAPDRTDFSALAAVQADPFIEDEVPHGVFLYSVVVSFHHHFLGFAVLLRKRLVEFFFQGVERVGPFVLRQP